MLEGNKQVYPPADTIARTKKLDWVCDLKPGMYRFYFMAEDTISGARNFMQINETFISVNQSGALRGLYLLTETIDGNTDIEVLNSQLQFITGFVDAQYFHYYSKKTDQPFQVNDFSFARHPMANQKKLTWWQPIKICGD